MKGRQISEHVRVDQLLMSQNLSIAFNFAFFYILACKEG